MTAADYAAVEVIPRCPGKGPSSGGTSGIREGHLATQVKALIQSEENPAGKGFYEGGVEMEMVGCHFVFQKQNMRAKGRQAAAPSLFNTQLTFRCFWTKTQGGNKKGPMITVIIKLHIL